MASFKIVRVDSRTFLEAEHLEISGYDIKSSADGSTELNIKISGISSEFEVSANLEDKKM